MRDVRQVSGVAEKPALTSAYAATVAATPGGRRFGALIRAHRTDAKLTQEQLADRATYTDDNGKQRRVSLSTIGRWERGDVQNPGPDELGAVVGALGISRPRALLALGYLRRDDIEALSAGAADDDPVPAPVKAFFADPELPAEKRGAALQYIEWVLEQWRREQRETGD